MAFDLSDYVTVAQRLSAFYERYPDGRVASFTPEVVTIGDRTFVSVTASVWRSTEDIIPCSATAWEPFPGKTPYTKDSEMMNAETSAIGRALAAAGISVSRSLSSQDEVRNRVSTPSKAKQPQTPNQNQRPQGKPKDQDRLPSKAATKPSDGLAPAASIDSLMERIAALPDAFRKSCKDEFVIRFGKPAELKAKDLEAATSVVAKWELDK